MDKSNQEHNQVIKNKPNKTAIMLFVLGIGIGLLFSMQFKTPITRVSNPVTPYIALQDSRAELQQEQIKLKNEISLYQDSISQKESELKQYTTSKKTIEEIEEDKEKVGLTELKGEGITINFDDSNQVEAILESVTHAADLRDIVNFLWGIGAEAISINDERIVFPTSIDCIVNTILINSTKKVPPFEIKAIGNKNTLNKQFSNEDNLTEIKKRVKNQGLVFEIIPQDEIVIPAYDGSFNMENINIVE